jgi:hypothetical protein
MVKHIASGGEVLVLFMIEGIDARNADLANLRNVKTLP